MLIRKQRGYSLIEIILVIIIMVALTSYGAKKYGDYKRNVDKKVLLDQHINQFKLLIDASANWANTKYTDIVDDTHGAIGVHTMDNEGYLPDNFGLQSGGTARNDLLGLWFRVFYDKSLIEFNGVENQTIRLLITSTLTSPYNAFPANLIPTKFADIESRANYDSFVSNWYRSLGSMASSLGLVAGIVEANSTTVKGINEAFSFALDTTLFPIGTAPYSRVVFFWGWPELNGFAGGVDTTPTNVDLAGQYSECFVSKRLYHRNNLNTDFCASQPNMKNLIDLTSFSTSAPSPFYSIPGFGAFYSYVSTAAITDLSSLGYTCNYKAEQYCYMVGITQGTSQGHCGSSTNPDHLTVLSKLCLSTPVYSLTNNAVLGGGVYFTDELYKDGSFTFGTVNGVRYEVNVGSELLFNNQYTFCCPNDVPDLN